MCYHSFLWLSEMSWMTYDIREMLNVHWWTQLLKFFNLKRHSVVSWMFVSCIIFILMKNKTTKIQYLKNRGKEHWNINLLTSICKEHSQNLIKKKVEYQKGYILIWVTGCFTFNSSKLEQLHTKTLENCAPNIWPHCTGCTGRKLLCNKGHLFLMQQKHFPFIL